ncbi:MAG: phosphonate ABC transporter, permease protein PhnE [Cyanobacteria bacterium J06641_5]
MTETKKRLGPSVRQPQARYDRTLQKQHRARQLQMTQLVALAGVVAVSFYFVDLLNWQLLLEGVSYFFGILGEMLPPDFGRAREWIGPLMDTLAMSIAGTAIAIFFSVPLALLGARNTTPHPVFYYCTRSILNVTRAIPELILGMILVVAVGFGKLPGTLALGLHSIGMVAKFFSEAIELADKAPIEATRSVGASELQVIFHGILPQVLPQMADVSLYRWEYNFRASLVLGAVGAGGIGLEIDSALSILEYQQVSALLIVILVLVTLVDSCSNFLRKRFV